MSPLDPLGGPLEPDLIPTTEVPLDLYEDDKHSSLRDEWYAEEREWMDDFREVCR